MSDAPARGLAVRDATPADRPAIVAIAAANDEPVAFPGIDGSPHLDHLFGRGRVVVATSDVQVIGFGASIAVGSSRHVSDLFVDPGFHGRGAGGAMLEALRAGDPTAGWTTFSSADPRALPLYVRSGLRPYWPQLYLVLTGSADLGAPEGFYAQVVPAELAANVERELTGQDRSADYRYWSSLAGARSLIVSDGAGAVVAAGVARAMRLADGQWLEHLTCGPTATERMAAAIVLAALRALPAAPAVGLCIPGPHPATRPLLEAGFRVFDRDTYCATDPAIVDPIRRVLDPSFL